jgi:hypothetical protein
MYAGGMDGRCGYCGWQKPKAEMAEACRDDILSA